MKSPGKSGAFLLTSLESSARLTPMVTRSIQLDLGQRSLATLYTLFMSARSALDPEWCTMVINNMVTTSEGDYAGGEVTTANYNSVAVYALEDGNHVMYVNAQWTDGHGHSQDLRFTFSFDESGEVLRHTAEVLDTEVTV